MIRLLLFFLFPGCILGIVSVTSPPVPPNLQSLECAIHKFALLFGTDRLNHTYGHQTVSAALTAALNIAEICNITNTYREKQSIYQKLSKSKPKIGDKQWFVSTSGSDNNDGSMDHPFRTLYRAQNATRSFKCRKDASCTVYILEGTYYLSKTLLLGVEDSYVHWSAYQSAQVVLAGSQLLGPLNWQPYENGPVMMAKVKLPDSRMDAWLTHARYIPKENCTFEENIDYDGNDILTTMASSAADCCAKCQAHSGCKFYTIEHKAGGTCWLKNSDAGRRTYKDHVSGSATSSPLRPPPKVNSIFIDGRRQIRARYPNGDPQSSDGICFSKNQRVGEGCKSYARAKGGGGSLPSPGPVVKIRNIGPNRGLSPTKGCSQCLDYGSFQYSIFPPPLNHPVYNQPLPGIGWSNNSHFNFWGSLFSRPADFVVDIHNGWTNKTWHNPNTGFVNMFHGGLWGGWQFALDRVEVSGSETQIYHAYGGWQEGRGSKISNNHFYVENIFEELDSPGEWFYSHENSTFYIYPNFTTDINTHLITVPLINQIIAIKGDPIAKHYVQSITFTGIEFTQTRRTQMEQYEVPSGGDWSIYRGGAFFVQDAEDIRVENCKFDQVGGNGVFFSNHVERSTVRYSEFVSTGDSSIAALGSTHLDDGSVRTYPNHLTISNNHMHDNGIYGKQSSCYFQSLTANTTLSDNVCYNGPRAGFNWNDDFGGNNTIKGNLIFNMVRETGDHGPYNSWDRQPYWTVNGVDDGFDDSHGRSYVKAMDIIIGNFIINGYNSVWTIDHDDGSQFMTDHGNFMIWGGCKNYRGNSKWCENNVIVYPGINVRASGGRRCQTDDNGIFANQFYQNNQCITMDGEPYTWGRCDPNRLNNTVYHTSSNIFYSPDEKYQQTCGSKTYNFPDWTKAKQDAKSTLANLPTNDEIVTMGKKILGYKTLPAI